MNGVRPPFHKKVVNRTISDLSYDYLPTKFVTVSQNLSECFYDFRFTTCGSIGKPRVSPLLSLNTSVHSSKLRLIPYLRQTSSVNRQTSGESASLPQYLGCNMVFDMRLRVTFLRRKTVSLQSNIAHRE